MEQHFENLRATRQKMAHFSENISINHLNKVPGGFNNNIFWNLGHIVVTQQLLVYRMAGHEGYLEESFIDQFRKGTKVEKVYDESDLSAVKSHLMRLVDKTEEDYNKGLFTSYKSYQTSYGVTLNSVEDAIIFNNMHEALHLGYVMALRKCIA